MESRAQATSLLEFLTTKNPEVDQPELAHKTLTSSPLYYIPKQLKAWDEFNFETLQQIFGGDLIREARRMDRVLPYPMIIPEADCKVTDERTTTRLLAKWNESIVISALLAVDKKFNATVWNSSVRVHEKTDVGSKHKRKGSRVQPSRKLAYRVKKQRKHLRLRPDSGAIASSPSFELDGSAALSFSQERFPKEYKTASKWQSDALLRGEVTNSEGEWVDGHEESNYAMPIRQAFTYCVTYECRYGCILTCGEAFIFRVRPRGQPDDGLEHTKNLLKQGLMDDGLLEYVSIPWDNHHKGSLDEHRDLTVNLALWFVHILAGNHYKIDWDYGPLNAEGLLCQPPEESTERETEDVLSNFGSETSRNVTPRGARFPVEAMYQPLGKEGEEGKEEEDGDDVHFSFSENFTPLAKVRRSMRKPIRP